MRFISKSQKCERTQKWLVKYKIILTQKTRELTKGEVFINIFLKQFFEEIRVAVAIAITITNFPSVETNIMRFISLFIAEMLQQKY